MHLSSCVSLGRESSSSNSTTSHSFPSTFNVLCVPSIKRKHTHKVAQLHVDTRKAYYLQERYHKERIVAGYVVEHTGNTKCHRFYERYPSPCHNGIEHPNDRLLCHVLRTSFLGVPQSMCYSIFYCFNTDVLYLIFAYLGYLMYQGSFNSSKLIVFIP